MLHPNHFLMVLATERLFDLRVAHLNDPANSSAMAVADALSTVELGMKILKVTDLLEPEMARSRGRRVIGKWWAFIRIRSRSLCTV